MPLHQILEIETVYYRSLVVQLAVQFIRSIDEREGKCCTKMVGRDLVLGKIVNLMIGDVVGIEIAMRRDVSDPVEIDKMLDERRRRA